VSISFLSFPTQKNPTLSFLSSSTSHCRPPINVYHIATPSRVHHSVLLLSDPYRPYLQLHESSSYIPLALASIEVKRGSRPLMGLGVLLFVRKVVEEVEEEGQKHFDVDI